MIKVRQLWQRRQLCKTEMATIHQEQGHAEEFQLGAGGGEAEGNAQRVEFGCCIPAIFNSK